MEQFYGKGISDTNKISTEYFFINNFGYVNKINKDIQIIRKNGRLDYQIIYIEKGFGYFLIDGKLEKADTGSIIILRPGEENFYKFSADSNSNFFWIHFTGQGVYNILKNLKLDRNIFNIGEFYEFKETITSMAQASAVFDFTTDSFLSSSVCLLLSKISKKLYVPDTPLKKVLMRMQNETINTLKNSDYASMCKLSEFHFIRTFKKTTGLTPHKYMAEITTNKAIELLTTTTLNISEIAYLLGFEDSLYFSRFFKKETGKSPKNYLSQRN